MTQIIVFASEKAYICIVMAENYTYVPGAQYPYQYKYEHMAVTTDCIIFTYEDRNLKVLLIRRGLDPFKGEWAFPGGFLRINETARQGALRELFEETKLKDAPIRELGVFSDVDRDPRERTITIAWYALVRPHEVLGGDDAEEAAWFPIDELPELAFDHAKIFEAAMERLRRDIHFEPVGFELLDDTFTIPDLQRLYEIILGKEFDRRNFQRKMMASGILEEVKKEKPKARRKKKDEEEDVLMCCMEAPMICEDADYSIAYDRMIAPEALPTIRAERPRTQKKSTAGRKGSFWHFNREKYDEMKEDGGKMEF